MSSNGIYNKFSMHLEDKLAFVKNYLNQQHSLLYKNSYNHPNMDENSLLKTCFYHIKSLNQSMQNQYTQVVMKENQPCQLPKITQKPLTHNLKKSSSANLLPKNSLLLSKLISESGFRASTSNILKIPNSILLKNPQTSKKLESETKIRKKHYFKNLYKKPTGLNKEQRFYQNQKVNLQGQLVQKLGFYEASNLYKAKNLQSHLQQMKVIASKPQFNPIMMASKDDLFLTNIQGQSLDFCVQEFIEKELNKQKLCQKVIHQCNSIRVSREGFSDQIKQAIISFQERSQIEQSDLYITIKDYCFLQDQSFKMFKAKQISIWGDVLLSFRRIIECMKFQKISFLKVKSDKFILWGGKKVSMIEMARLLGLQLIEKAFIKIQKICIGFLDRLKVRRIKQQIKRKESLARWVSERLKTFTYLRKERRQKKAKAYQLYNQLVQNMQWDTQIHLPSFSMDQFKRNTTQYLESFQNMYHAMWKDSTKHLILVLPTLNQNIIKILQNRIRVKRSLTIICPEIHQCFPINLSLSAQVLFSYETLKKIEKAIDGKKSVLIPGCYQNDLKLNNQLLLSEYLNVPLLCSLQMSNNYSSQNDFFTAIDIANDYQCIIAPNTSLAIILDQFCDLLMKKPCDKTWIIKLQGEFKGRGIATIKINPSKYFKQQNNAIENKAIIAEYLKTNFKLKIKINFQNSLYTVDHFLRLLQTNGGLIQEQINAISTYQICFTKHAISQLQYLYKVYGTDYCNKIWLSTEPSGQMQELISVIQCHLDSSHYLGNINITVCKGSNHKIYGIDIKLHKTYASSMIDFIGMIEQKRIYHHQQAASIESLPTKRPTHNEIASTYELSLQNYSYLIIPHLVFTDIEEEVKAKLIEEMMKECWNDRHVKLHEEGRVFLSMGVDFSIVLFGKDVKRLKKKAIDSVRELNDRTSSYRKYRGKQVVRDVFHYGDIIRSLSQIKQ